MDYSSKSIIKLLEGNGWCFDRQRGSHKIFIKEGSRPIVVPCHGGKDINPNTYRAILKQAGLK